MWVAALALGKISLAALVAMILARQPFAWRLLRTVYFVPVVISQVAIAMMWRAIYNAEYGIINQTLERIGAVTLATAFALRHFITLIRTTIGRRDAASDSSQ